jgi:hypothetical protein
LIEQTEDCYYYFKKPVEFKTGIYGERIIENKGTKKTIVAIGESQLMGLDWSDHVSSAPHDLDTLFPDSNFKLFAAPNNGPVQNYYRLKDIPKSVMREADSIVIAFNYSTDIFRILDGWDHKDSSPISFASFQLPLFKVALFDLFIMNARLAGKKFGDTVPKNNVILEEYKRIDKNYLLEEYVAAQMKLIESIQNANKNISLIIYPPYWGLDGNGTLLPEIEQDYQQFICVSFERLSGVSAIYYSSNTHFALSDDQRHFPQSSLMYSNKKRCLPKQG